MIPKDRNLYKVLELLVLLFRTKRQNNPKASEEELYTLNITQEHLDKNNLTVATFHNALTRLDKRGYLYGFSILEDKFYSELDQVVNDVKYNEALEQLKKIDTEEIQTKIKESIANYYEERIPATHEFDKEGLMEGDISLMHIMEIGREKMIGIANSESKVVSIVLLMPFRDIVRLYDQMGDGKAFDEVKDAGIWYDSENMMFHYDDKSISTKHNKKAYTHYALKGLFGQYEDTKVFYAELEEFDMQRETDKELKSYRDSLKSFMKKDKRLDEIFSVQNKYLEIHEDYLNQSH